MSAVAPFSSTRLRAWFSSSDRLAFFGLLGLLFVFYPDLFLVKAAPLTGDHLEQHYPWAFQLAQSLRELRLPFWTPLIHCGFPLVAESQIGAFYLPNLILYFCLPFHTAYSYMNLFHWLVAGWGTYLYAKQMKLGAMAAFVAAAIFTFGGAYGGAYYNMTSLKTICWFPVALYLLERYLDKPKRWLLFVMGFVIGQSLVAGYLQMAVFTWLIFIIYSMVRILALPENASPWVKKILTLGDLTLVCIFALLLALPQVYLTFQLAMLSNRLGLEEGYAYVGSMSPMVLGTLICPNLSNLFRGNNLYPGAFALFLTLIAFCSLEARKSKTFRLWGIMTFVALLLALGQWSPLYVALVKITKFYSFRFPAKFSGFFCFGIAMLSAIGYHLLWRGKFTQALAKKAFYAYLSVLALFLASIVSLGLFFTVGKKIALEVGRFFVMRFVYAQPGHPHSLDAYLSRVSNYINALPGFLSLTDPGNLISIVASGLCIVLLVYFLKKKISPKAFLVGSVVFLLADLYAAAHLDIKLEFATYQKVLAPTKIRKILEREKSAGRLGRIYGFRSPDQRLPLTPSQNMLYGIEDIGVYSPLVISRYYQSVGLFGNVNDSNLAVTPTPAFVVQRLPLLSFLNVSHILSTEKLIHPDLELIFTDLEAGVYLYALNRRRSEAYFIDSIRIEPNWEALKADFLKEGFDPSKTLLLENAVCSQGNRSGMTSIAKTPGFNAMIHSVVRRSEYLMWNISVTGKGFFVLSDLDIRGWKATVNEKAVKILPAFGLFRAIEIEKAGTYRIEMKYQP